MGSTKFFLLFSYCFYIYFIIFTVYYLFMFSWIVLFYKFYYYSFSNKIFNFLLFFNIKLKKKEELLVLALGSIFHNFLAFTLWIFLSTVIYFFRFFDYEEIFYIPNFSSNFEYIIFFLYLNYIKLILHDDFYIMTSPSFYDGVIPCHLITGIYQYYE